MDAGEKIFAQRGFKGASMREITAEADVNIAAANYHFGGKEALFKDILKRYADIMDSKRTTLLENAPKPYSLDTLIQALIFPSFDYIKENPRSGSYMARLLSRIPFEIPEIAMPLFSEYFLPSFETIENYMREALPTLSEPDFIWYCHCVRAVFHQAINILDVNSDLFKAYPWDISAEEAKQKVIDAAYALLAPLLQKNEEASL